MRGSCASLFLLLVVCFKTSAFGWFICLFVFSVEMNPECHPKLFPLLVVFTCGIYYRDSCEDVV